MAVTISSDLIVRHAMDALTNTGGIGNVGAPTAIDTAIKVQGTGSGRTSSVTNPPALGGMSGSFTAGDFTKLHILCWVNNLDKVKTLANNGWRIRVASSLANMTTNFGEWTVGGQDTYIAPISGFQRWCIDTNRPFDFVTGTPPALASIAAIGLVAGHLTASTRATWFSDSYDTATGLTVKGGTTGDLGKSIQIANDDETQGRGLFKDIGGAFYVLGRVTIGDTAASSEFADSNEVWVFENQRVSATFNLIEFVGDAGVGVNNAKFGTKSGTGVATEASGGNSFKATGDSPFSIRAIDANIAVGLYGSSFTNPVALKEDAPRAVQYATAADVFTNQTRAAGDATANDFLFMPATEAVGDYSVYGHEEPFSQLKINVGTAGTVGVVVWEYWNGTAWAALTNVTDGTNSFKTAGTNLVTYSIPDDWSTTTLNGLGAYYYIRARVTTVYTVNPLGTQTWCVMGGRVRLEASTVEAIRSVFTNMDTIRVRNGAFLKKCTITNSVAPAKSAAVDLGSADPATDTVRDLTIQNCIKGILLKGTSAGATTYNFRNIKFAGNTNDVRVDFPAAATVTINILEGGSTPTVDNVNGSTVNVVTAAVLTVAIKDSNGNVITGASEVTIVRTSDDVVLFTEENVTTGSSAYSYSTGAGTTVHINVHNVPNFQNKTFSGHVLSASSETITVQLDDDRVYLNP